VPVRPVTDGAPNDIAVPDCPNCEAGAATERPGWTVSVAVPDAEALGPEDAAGPV